MVRHTLPNHHVGQRFDFGGEQGFEITDVGVSLARDLFGNAAVLRGDGGDPQGLAMGMDRSFLEERREPCSSCHLRMEQVIVGFEGGQRTFVPRQQTQFDGLGDGPGELIASRAMEDISCTPNF